MNANGFKRWVWWAVFILATVMLSQFIQRFKAFTLAPNLETGLMLLGVILLLLLSCLALIYDGYLKEKQKGSVHHPVRLFEALHRFQLAKLNQGDSVKCHKH